MKPRCRLAGSRLPASEPGRCRAAAVPFASAEAPASAAARVGVGAPGGGGAARERRARGVAERALQGEARRGRRAPARRAGAGRCRTEPGSSTPAGCAQSRGDAGRNLETMLLEGCARARPPRGGRRSWLRALRAVPGGKYISPLLSRLLGSLSILSWIPKMGASGEDAGLCGLYQKVPFESSLEPRGGGIFELILNFSGLP